MRRVLLLLCVIAPAALAQVARPHSGPFSWTAGEYRYDGAGNITAIGSESFVYDKIGRLKSATVRGPDLTTTQTQTFGYDAYGNLTSASKLGQTVLLPVDEGSNRLTGIGYDGAGNLVTSGAVHYGYDALGMMNTVRVGSSLQPQLVYAYTADDERLLSFDVSSNTTHWTLRGLDNRVLRVFRQEGSSWSVERDYVYRDGHLLAALKPAGTVEHYTLDHLGTPRLITDGAGNKIGYHVYWPYGEEWSAGNAQEGNPLKFTGHERDAATALDYMHARHYGATFGRFSSVDPVLGKPTSPQSWNRYSYVLGNPMNRIDPDGRCEQPAGSPPCSDLTVTVSAPNPSTLEHVKFILNETNAQLTPFGFIEAGSPEALWQSYQARQHPQPSNVRAGIVFMGDLGRVEPGAASRYDNVTKPRSIPNRSTNVSRASFESNLVGEGYSKSVSSDGKATIYSKGNIRYVVRATSTSTGQPTADVYKDGRPVQKIRLAEETATKP